MSKTLRLLMPQWQGGNNPAYALGARLLAWLAPGNENTKVVEVPVEAYKGETLALEEGVIARSALLKQLYAAKELIEDEQPERIIVFGGDCLVAQAPFAYLNEKYGGNLGVLWLDSHPDVSTPQMYDHVHAMVLGNLLGEGKDEGEKEFAAEVKMPIKADLIMYGGLQQTSTQEAKIINRLQLRKVGPGELAQTSQPVLDWIKEKKIRQLAIHLDVLDPNLFRSLLFAKPEGLAIDSPSGTMTLAQIARVIKDVSQQTDVVGLAIAEHLPWDAINMQNFLEELPIFKE